MGNIKPLKSKKKIKVILDHLKEVDITGRDHLLFYFGIHSPLRISEILNLRMRDVFWEKYRYREYVRIKENRTSKLKLVNISEKVRKRLKTYARKHRLKPGNYIFFSKHDRSKPLDIVSAYKMLNKAAFNVGARDVGTHTLRKTFGYHHYQKHREIGLLMQLFGHSSAKITYKYLGINPERAENPYDNLDCDLY